MTVPSGHGKLLDLKEAVRRFVKPGMHLHLAGGIGGPGAAVCELIRQFRGKEPHFTVIQATVTGHSLNLIQCRLAQKLICSVAVDISSSGRPSKVIQSALENGELEMENWSLLSLQQRLMAGAFGVPFMPTKSVAGSSIALDNQQCFKTIADPFGTGAAVGIVSALVPDISFVHGCIADAEGNTVMPVPYGEDCWGALASRGGVIVTVERIVSTECIRKYAALVKIPACAVAAVVEAPMGLHPFCLANPGIEEIEPYEKDAEFLAALHEAFSSGQRLESWISGWVLDCPDHGSYLAKLGAGRIAELKERSRRLPAGPPAAPAVDDVSFQPREMMLIALAREILRSVGRHGHKLVLAGAGAAATAAFLAFHRLKCDGFELATGNGQIGYTPVPGESILASEPGVRSGKMLTDTVLMQGVFIGGGNSRALSILGAGQMDKYGNINSTKTSEGKFLVGSGGVNDALNAREAILCLDQSKERFVETLAYLTGRGDAVTAVVSTKGIFRKESPQGELVLAACFPDAGRSLEERIQEIRENCGWELKTAAVVEEVARPGREELQLLRWLTKRQS